MVKKDIVLSGNLFGDQYLLHSTLYSIDLPMLRLSLQPVSSPGSLLTLRSKVHMMPRLEQVPVCSFQLRGSCASNPSNSVATLFVVDHISTRGSIRIILRTYGSLAGVSQR